MMPNSSLGRCSLYGTWCENWVVKMTGTMQESTHRLTQGHVVTWFTIPMLTLRCCSFLSYRTSQYKLHYYETPSNTKFVMLTDTKAPSMRIALHQIWVNIYVEFVVKNPLSPVEHPGG